MLKRRSRRYVPAAARAADAAGARSGKGDLDDVDRFFDSDASAMEETRMAAYEEEPTPAPILRSPAAAKAPAGVVSPSPVQGLPRLADLDGDLDIDLSISAAPRSSILKSGRGSRFSAAADDDAPKASTPVKRLSFAADASPVMPPSQASTVRKRGPGSRGEPASVAKPSPLATHAAAARDKPGKQPTRPPPTISTATGRLAVPKLKTTTAKWRASPPPDEEDEEDDSEVHVRPQSFGHYHDADQEEEDEVPLPSAYGRTPPRDAKTAALKAVKEAALVAAAVKKELQEELAVEMAMADADEPAAAAQTDDLGPAEAEQEEEAPMDKAAGRGRGKKAAGRKPAAQTQASASTKPARNRMSKRRKLLVDSDAEDDDRDAEFRIDDAEHAEIEAEDDDADETADADVTIRSGNATILADASDDADRTIYVHGRPQRRHIKPVQYWKGERPVYKQVIKGGKKTGVFVLKDVLTADTPEDVRGPSRRIGARTGKAGSPRKATRKAPKKGVQQTNARASPSPPPAASDAFAAPQPSAPALTLDMMDNRRLDTSHVLVEDWLAPGNVVGISALKTYGMCDWRQLQDGDIKFCKIFSQTSNGWSAGHIMLQPGAAKGEQNTRANFLIFCVTLGNVQVTLRGTTFTAGPGTSFYVPPQNDYNLINSGNDVTSLFFIQVRQMDELAQGATAD